MASYSVFLVPAAQKQIEDLEKRDRLRVLEAVGALAEEPRPRGCEKLSTLEKYRIRVGTYRVVYTIDDAVVRVVVVRVGRRRDVYRRKG
ncbi:MAG TPA: type II toxin-antitoxin system RelE/ParE family toxin [Coriobacteriia bacterium]